MIDHERWADAAGAYVLEAMPADERRRYEAHLAACEICRREVEELRPAAEALPVASPPLRPPPALKTRIMAEVEREAALLAEAGPRADRPRRRRRWPVIVFGRLAPVAAAVALGSAIAQVGGGEDTHTYRATVDRAQVPGARAELRIEDGEAMLVAQGLPEPRDDRVYQVWIKRRGEAAPEPSVLFLPRNGSAMAAVPDAMDNAEAVLVTFEPRRGSDTPSGPPVVTVPMT